MLIIEPSFVIETPLELDDRVRILKLIESAGRTCYKSEGKATETSYQDFVRKIVQVKKHESVIEHAGLTVRFILDRGVSHELVRHRIAAYSQESTRYCNYSKEQFGEHITVIRPLFFAVGTEDFNDWKTSCEMAENMYFRMIQRGRTPQEARSVLPNSLKTEVVMTANMREWRHVIKLRASPQAHPQIRQVMHPLALRLQQLLPELFGDLLS